MKKYLAFVLFLLSFAFFAVFATAAGEPAEGEPNGSVSTVGEPTVSAPIAGESAERGSAVGRTYYVDAENGNDASDGTSEVTAWKTLGRADDVTYAAGDRLLLKRGGRYPGVFIPNGDGTADAPIVFSAYGEGDAPIIVGEDGFFSVVFCDAGYWTVEDLFFTSPEGWGIWIYAANDHDVVGITIRNCVFRDISPDATNVFAAAIRVDNTRQDARVRDLHLDSLLIEDAAWGVHCSGISDDDACMTYEDRAVAYNTDYLFENLVIRRATRGGIVLASVMNATVRYCRVLDCATVQDDAHAPLWMRHTDGATVEYCEIAGSTNKIDGMAIDFDGWTVNSTYRYIYSHDNTRFIKNCVFDKTTGNAGNRVEHCISVNDNKGLNYAAVPCLNDQNPTLARMRGLTFFDNCIVNGSPIVFAGALKPTIDANRFFGGWFFNLLQRIFLPFSAKGGFSYGKTDEAQIAPLVDEILRTLPAA